MKLLLKQDRQLDLGESGFSQAHTRQLGDIARAAIRYAGGNDTRMEMAFFCSLVTQRIAFLSDYPPFDPSLRRYSHVETVAMATRFARHAYAPERYLQAAHRRLRTDITTGQYEIILLAEEVRETAQAEVIVTGQALFARNEALNRLIQPPPAGHAPFKTALRHLAAGELLVETLAHEILTPALHQGHLITQPFRASARLDEAFRQATLALIEGSHDVHWEDHLLARCVSALACQLTRRDGVCRQAPISACLSVMGIHPPYRLVAASQSAAFQETLIRACTPLIEAGRGTP